MSILHRTIGVMTGPAPLDKQALAVLADPAAAGIVRADHGALVLGSNGVELARLAALLAGGCSVTDILIAYPSLDASSLEQATGLIDRYGIDGAGFPVITAKRALASAGLDALDAVLDGTSAGA